MIDHPLLSEVLAGRSLPFTVDGRIYRIRQPTTEEYDDAMMIQRMMYQHWLRQPQVQRLAEQEPSEEHQQIFQELIADLEKQIEALSEDDLGRRHVLQTRIKQLKHELGTRNLAQEIAVERATLARDRWLCARLLCDENGEQLFDTGNKDFEVAWENTPIALKDAARPVIWRMMAQVATVPFGWEGPREPASL